MTRASSSSAASGGPLAGLTVLDLSRVFSGPYCTMLLGDMGARVIKIEQPGRGDDTRAWGPPFVAGESAYYLSLNRNKESVALDFKHPEARRLLDRLIDRADVLVENFRPGTLARIGLGYADLAPRLPRLVYCAISGFGQTGPKRTRPGYDAVIQAEAGLMSITGPEGGRPYRLGVAISDLVTGMFAMQGILLALIARSTSGRGQLVDVGMLDATAAVLTYQAGIFLATGQVPQRLGNRHPTIAPYETFETADGELVLAVGNDEIWQRFCRAVGLDQLAVEPRFATNGGRIDHYDALRPVLVDLFRADSRAHWIARLEAAAVPCGSVKTIDEVCADEQLQARQMIATVPHPAIGQLRLIGVPVKLSATPGRVVTAPPMRGQHTARVLRDDLGVDDRDLARLRTEGAIEVADWRP